MDTILLTGLFAAFFTTFAFTPQSIKTLRTRNTEGIFVVMYIMFLTGVISWIAYAILRSHFAVLAAKIVTLFLATPVLVMTLLNRRKKAYEYCDHWRGSCQHISARNAIKAGHSVVLFEKNARIGGIWDPWNGGAYRNACIQNYRYAFHYTDFPTGNTDEFPGVAQVFGYLSAVAGEGLSVSLPG